MIEVNNKVEINNPYTDTIILGRVQSVNTKFGTCKVINDRTNQAYKFYMRPDGSLHGQGTICHLTAKVV